MDPAILSATSGLVGSLIGGVSTFTASWVTSHRQYRAQTLVQEAVRREALYAEFLEEAAARFADAWSHKAVGPEAIAGLLGAVARMRLTSPRAVIDAAEEVVRRVVDAYAAPNRTFDDLQKVAHAQAGEWRNRLLEFSEVCRAELLRDEQSSRHGRLPSG